MEKIVTVQKPNDTGHIIKLYGFYGHQQKYLQCLYMFRREVQDPIFVDHLYEYVLVDAKIVESHDLSHDFG